MAERYLIDTSAVIKYLNGTFTDAGLSLMDKIVDVDCLISFIVEIELQSWNPPNPIDLKRYEVFVASSTVIGVNKSIIDETIRIRKKFRLKLPDALIAATAITNNMILLSDNDKDFKRVTNLKYLNPNTAASQI
jgi:predicted nucleic acid-binding protein